MKAAGFDTTFINALGNKNIGGASGGADFNPYNKSETEIQVLTERTFSSSAESLSRCFISLVVLYSSAFNPSLFSASLLSLLPLLSHSFSLIPHYLPHFRLSSLSLPSSFILCTVEILPVVHDRALQVYRTRHRPARSRRRGQRARNRVRTITEPAS